jgi:hypothetical protein
LWQAKLTTGSTQSYCLVTMTCFISVLPPPPSSLSLPAECQGRRAPVNEPAKGLVGVEDPPELHEIREGAA